MLRKAQSPSAASGCALRLLLAKANLMAAAGDGVCLSSSLRFVASLALAGSALQVDSSLRPVHHDISDLAERVLLVCRGSHRPGAQGGPRSGSRWERLSRLSEASIPFRSEPAACSWLATLMESSSP